MSEAGDSAAARPEQNDAVAPGEAPTVAADVARADVAADAREPTDAGDGAAGSGTEPPAAESEPGAPVSAGGGAPQGGGDAIASQPPVSQKAADGDAAASSSEARREDENVATACDGDSSQPEAAAAADAGSDRTAAPDGAQASGPQPAGAPPAAAHPEPAAAPHAASDGPATAPATAPRSSEPTAPPGDAAPPDAPAKAAPTPAPAASESAEAPAPATPALGPPQFTAERPADLPVPWPRSLPPKLTGRFVVRAGPHSGRIVGAPEMCASVERLHAGLSGAPLPPIDDETMRQLRQAQRAAMIDKGRVLSAAEAEEVSMRLYTAKAERPQSAPVRAVRVQHIKTETGQWVDRLLPARKLTPERKTEVMVAMYERGRNDAAKRDEALAAKYLRPLTAGSARIEFRPKTPKPAAEGAIKAVYMSAEITRVTPPRAGTSVYPGGNWQLPG